METNKIKYEPGSTGFNVNDVNVIEFSDEERLHESMYYSNFVDPEVASKYSEEFNVRALKPLLAWIDERVKDPEIVQYQEIIGELDKFEPKYCCEMAFCRSVLLPDLKKSGKLSSLPESLVAILYTLHLVHSEGTRLISVEKQGQDLLFTAEFDSRIGDEIVTDACDYRLKNYLDPERAELAVDDSDSD